jgi:PGF-pre-PGF domain-containing protein/PGF-CTERM protein
VVSGSSAGGFGTILHFNKASEIFNKPIIAINDAGPGTQANATSPFRNQILFDRWGIRQNYPPDSLQYFENSDPLRFLNWALNESLGGCGNCIYALFEDQWDIVIGPYFQGYSFTDYQARLLELVGSIKANFSDRFCAYLPLSTYHTAFAGGYNYPVGDRFYALNINGYYLRQWIGDVLSGNCRDAIDLGQRDLQVEILSYPNNAIVNTSYNITVKVSNLGNNSTPDPFFVLLTSDTAILGYKVYQLPANSNETFNFTWTPTATGQYRLNVTADGLPSPALATLLPFGSVVELLNFPASEANNRVSFSVSVTTPPAPTPTPTTPTPTPTPIPTTPRPPVGGGGGGGGYIPGTGVYYTARELVKAGESYEIAMPQSFFIETGVLSITVTPREDTTVQLRVERLKELPPGIPRPEGLAVLILSIEPRTGFETSLSGKIKFGVSIEEIKAKGFNLNLVTVILMRWDGSRWTELPTKFLSSDGKYNYYEAETPGFSYFAAVIKVAPTPTPATTPMQTSTPMQTPTTPATTAPAKPFIPGFEAIFAIAGLTAVAYLLRRKN